MRNFKKVTLIFVLLICQHSMAKDVTKEIISYCRTEMSEYGASIVKACVDEEIRALKALNKYPSKYKTIVSRCMADMREYGFITVKACVDEDIKAEKALSKYEK